MSKKQYTVIRIVIAMLLAGAVSFSVTNENFIIPIFAVAASFVFLLILRRNVDEVLADERDYRGAGDAARWVISVYAGVAFLFSMMSLRIISGEDDWVCENGEWAAHGHPETPKPDKLCEKIIQ